MEGQTESPQSALANDAAAQIVKALHEGNSWALKKLIDQGVELQNGSDQQRALLADALRAEGPTVLLRASWDGNLTVMTWLLDRDVNPNEAGVWFKKGDHTDLMLPLLATAISGQAKAAKLLLEHGAKVGEGTGVDKGDPMSIALQDHHSDVARVLWEHGDRNVSEMCYAISQNAPLAELKKILDTGAPADPPQDKVLTPLGEAAEMDNLPAVALLVQYGADVNKGGNPVPGYPQYRDTPLTMAAHRGQDEMIAFLLQKGAHPNPDAVYEALMAGIPWDSYIRSTHIPSREHYERVVQLLIDAGALKDIDPVWTGQLLTKAMGPCWGDPDPVVLKELLDAGLSPEAPDPDLNAGEEKSDTVIERYRIFYKENKDQPGYEDQIRSIKPLIDMMENACKKDHQAAP